MREFQNSADKISEYSEWLSAFQGCEMDEEIEIPGTDTSSPLLYKQFIFW